MGNSTTTESGCQILVFNRTCPVHGVLGPFRLSSIQNPYYYDVRHLFGKKVVINSLSFYMSNTYGQWRAWLLVQNVIMHLDKGVTPSVFLHT
jgi:hypothetical protein